MVHLFINRVHLFNIDPIDIKNEVPDEDGIREIVDLWKDEESGEVNQAWMEHLEWLIGSFVSEQEV